MDLSKVFSAQWHSTFRDIVISTRLMPIQVLGRRATNTAFKYRALLRMLHLETGDIDLAKSRTRSFLNDMGVESKLSLVTEQDCVNPVNGLDRRAFSDTLPLHDLDHGMHHVMQELVDCWPELGQVFDRQLNAFSKYFSKRDNVERFCKFRIWESNMPQAAKATLAKVMMHTCPVFLEHRWQYRFEVLQWICEREQLLKLLDPATVRDARSRDEGHGEHEFTDMDVDALQLLYADPVSSGTFWALAYTMLVLCRWGHDVIGWLHGCWCHQDKESRDKHKKDTGKPCPWNGRRLIELSCGAAAGFINKLRSLTIARDKYANEKVESLKRNLYVSSAEQICLGFVTAKNMLEGRFIQLTSFLQEVPWNLVKLLRFVICGSDQVQQAVYDSRRDAVTLMSNFQAGRLTNIGDVGKKFFGHTEFSQGLIRWGRSLDVHMNTNLFRELVSYSTSLLVMQRLEAKHHLVHVTYCTI